MFSRKRIFSSLPALIIGAVLVSTAQAQFIQQGSKLVGSGALGTSMQGESVAVSADGNTMAVGGSADNAGQGAVWVYTRSGGVWTQQSKLVGNNPLNPAQQGFSVGLSADGNTLIEGGPTDGGDGQTGAAWVFTRSNGAWTQQAKLIATGTVNSAEQGSGVALSADGNTALVGGPSDNSNIGGAFVFTRTAGTWTQQGGELVGSGVESQPQMPLEAAQGFAVALSGDGNTALLGGYLDNGYAGATWVFVRSNNTWTQQGAKLVGSTSEPPKTSGLRQGQSVAISADRNTAVIGGWGDNGGVGAAWVFTRIGGQWGQQGNKLIGTNESGGALVGWSVSVSGDGNTALVGGYYDAFQGVGNDSKGAAWIFRRSNGAWAIGGTKIFGTGGIDGFDSSGTAIGPSEGWSVAISADGGTAVVGGNGDNSDMGAAWVFAQPHFTLTAPSTAAGGASFNFTVKAQDGNNTTLTSYAGTVHFTSSDSAAVLPADSALASGTGNFTATLKTTGSQTITATDTSNSGLTGTSNAISVTGQPATHFSVSAPPSAIADSALSFTVTALDAGNNTVAGYGGTVHFTSTDGAAVLPTNATLTAGTGTFSATLMTTGSQTITATDTASSGVTGASGAIAVSAGVTGGPQYTQQGSKLTGTGAVGPPQQGAVALSGDGNTLAVGGFNDNSKGGAVWIYTRASGVWTQQGNKLAGAGAVGGASQGNAVALSADGNTLIEGGPGDSSNAGAVWIFTRSGGVWDQGFKLVGPGATGNAQQGASVAISADGNTVAIGGPTDNGGAGAVWVYTRSAGVWSQQGGKLVGNGAVNGTSGAAQGSSVAVSSDGSTVLVGGRNDNGSVGAAWVYTRSAGVFTQQGGKLVGAGNAGSSLQGTSAAISYDGNTALVGGTGDDFSVGAAWAYTRTTGVWTQQGNKLVGTGIKNGRVAGASQGASAALSSDGNTALIGGPTDDGSDVSDSTGAAWVFKRSNGTWNQTGKLIGSGGVHGSIIGVAVGPGEGQSVALSADAGTAALGGPGDNSTVGAAWVFALAQIRLSLSAPSSATAGTALNFTVSALDPNNATVASYAGTVHFTSSDIAAGLPSDATISAGTGTFSATLRTGGSQTITATDKSDSGLTATSGTISVSGAPTAAQWFTQQGARLIGTGTAGSPAMQGVSVALSADGNTLAVGGPADNGGIGAVWIYSRASGVWNQQGNKLVGNGIVSTPPGQGGHVALSADGNTLIVGGAGDNSGAGAAWVFTRSNGVWNQQGNKLVGTGAAGTAAQGAVALSSDGNTAIIGGPSDNSNAGAAWVFTRDNTGAWTQQGAKLAGAGAAGSAGQGGSVALSGDGNTALVGGAGDNSSTGAVWVYTRTSGVWTQQGAKLVPLDAVTGQNRQVLAGGSVALSSDGNTAIMGGPADNHGLGAAWIFTRASGLWTQQGNKLLGLDVDSICAGCAVNQGPAVALSGDGNTALVGVPGDNSQGLHQSTGAGLIFRRSNGAWSEPDNKLSGSGGTFPAQGAAVALSADGSTAALGAGADTNGAGAVWVFALPRFSFSTPGTATGGVSFNFMISALDANNLLFPGYFGTLHFTSSDGSASLPADSSLSSGVLSLSATLRTAGNQTLAAADTTASGEAGTSSPIAVSVSTVPPTPVSVTPAGGNAASQMMTFVYNDPRGYHDLAILNVLVNNFIDGRHACYLAYIVQQSTLVLVDDAGDAGGPYAGSVALGSSTPIQNSQCSVVLVSALGSGNNLTLVLTITWTTSFAGDKIVHLAARDLEQNNSGWYPLGVARAPGGAQTTTTAVVGTTPFRGTGLGPTVFTFNFSDTKGYQDLGVENVLVNSDLDGGHACYLAYSRPANVMYLVNDNGNGLLPGQSMAASGSVSNSQCTAAWGSTPVTTAGNNLTLTLTITFTSAFGGNRIVYVAARDVHEANSTDWHAMGTWTPQ